MKKIHFIGICGAGMSAVAKLYKDMGWLVTGSDENFYPPVSTYLQKKKIKYFKGYDPKNIPTNVDLIVIGKHTGLAPELNKEVKAAFDSGKPIKSFAEVVGELTRDRKNIVVAGSYGKSTCAALISWVLEKAGKKPGYLIGAIPETPRESSALGKGKFFVIEGDEYPSSNWDSSSKFLHYHPSHILLTSLAHDHLNIYKTPADYRLPFKKLIKLLPKNGTLVACSSGDGNRAILSGINLPACPSGRRAGKAGKTIWYGFDKKCQWRGENIKYGIPTSFDLIRGSKKIATLKTMLPGRHNVENIVGASALLLNLKTVTISQLEKAIITFEPLTRRLDKKSSKTSIPVFEGFGSSREKAKAATEAVKLHYPEKKLIVVFEPHALSWRNRNALVWYDDVFNGADKVFIYKPLESNPADNQLTLNEIANRVRKTGMKTISFEKIEKGIGLLKKGIKDDNMILILSSGGFDGFLQSLIPWLEKNFPIT